MKAALQLYLRFLPSLASSSIPLFFLCGSWHANLNLFHCDITQQLCSCRGASLLGAPAPNAGSSSRCLPAWQPACSSLALGALCGFSGVFRRQRPNAALPQKCVPVTAPLALSPVPLQRILSFSTHSVCFEAHVTLKCHAPLPNDSESI